MRTVVFTLRMICLLLMGFIVDQTLYAARLTGKDNVNVTSSSQYLDWAPERVIDNNDRNDADVCKCCSATNIQSNQWYQLDFGKDYRVRRVYIKGRLNKLSGQCADGKYGDTCNNVCHCKGNPCNKTTGVCPSGECLPGYHGQQCDKLCSDGKYGSGCKDTCGNCLCHNEVCDKMTGTCPSSCSAGYRDDQCKTECVAGSYGHNCTKKCGKCLDNKSCNVTTGTCENGCSAGYLGLLCDIEITPSEKDSCSVPIGVAIGAILFIEAFVGAVVYIIWKRRQGQADKSSPEEVSQYEIPDRAAFASEHPYELTQRSVITIPTYENTLLSPTNE